MVQLSDDVDQKPTTHAELKISRLFGRHLRLWSPPSGKPGRGVKRSPLTADAPFFRMDLSVLGEERITSRYPGARLSTFDPEDGRGGSSLETSPVENLDLALRV